MVVVEIVELVLELVLSLLLELVLSLALLLVLSLEVLLAMILSKLGSTSRRLRGPCSGITMEEYNESDLASSTSLLADPESVLMTVPTTN